MKTAIILLFLALTVSCGNIKEQIMETDWVQYYDNNLELMQNQQDIFEKIGLTLLLGSNCFKDVAGELLLIDSVITMKNATIIDYVMGAVGAFIMGKQTYNDCAGWIQFILSILENEDLYDALVLGDKAAIERFNESIPADLVVAIESEKTNPVLTSQAYYTANKHDPLYKTGYAFYLLSQCWAPPGMGFLIIHIVKDMITDKGMPLFPKILFSTVWSAVGIASFYGTYAKCRDFILYLISIL